MSKNRTIPFGYCMKNGEITVDFTESKAVIKIFEEYLNGSSLLQIAKLMELEKIRYSVDSDHWNKNMVKRIIENEKYLGTDKYPQIISETFFNQANEKRMSKANTVSLVLKNQLLESSLSLDKKSDIFIAMAEYLEREQAVTLLNKIGLTEYEKIFLLRHRPKIKVDNLNKQILNVFVSKKWIDSFEVDTNKSEYYKVIKSSSLKK